ncbi:C2 and GRAM domain-containing protein [Apostasia shenzhenica]|uniref:C2 and GRAM domain-containing protein n=1 Tax=Apostasia shenzhenica TaxID=1088818 RepID=A0A2H9ZXE9_9ASPA|nr:C2 and GRAM domain-containing protein [Apostasia shenzhenica]
MKVAVEVLDASDLMPKDGQGSANPFVEVELDSQRHRTPTKIKDLNPSWNETLVFNLSDPALLPNLTIDVSVYHDRKQPFPTSDTATADAGGNPRSLGRVRISGVSVAPSPSEAPVLRFPLDKRGLFSHIRGDIALRLYAIPDSSFPSTAAAASAAAEAASILQPDPSPTVPPPQKEKKKKTHTPSEAADDPRVFFSVPAAAQASPAAPAAPAAPPVMEARAAAVPVPAAAMMQLPAGIPRPQSEYGLVETRPPLAGRLGYRSGDKISSTYDLVLPMEFLYVNVVKARDLPHKDVTGGLDPYVEVKLGNYKGITKHLEKNRNPIFNQIFAFSRDRLQANLVDITVKDKDIGKDDFVGRIFFDITDVPRRVPPDSPFAPQWYRLEDKKGEKLKNGEIMLAIWMGTQADEAFPEAWHSDAHSVGSQVLAHTRSKVYFSPKLCYLRVHVIEAQDLVPSDRTRLPDPVVRLQLGHQLRTTRSSPTSRSVNPVWPNEEFMLVAAEPFDEPLVITVDDRLDANKMEPLGRLVFPVLAAPQRIDHSKGVEPRWFNLAKPSSGGDEGEKKESKFSSKIHLRIYLDTGYHVLDESTHYSSDFRPAAKHLRKPGIGILELGILDARNLMPMKTREGKTTDAYCVAKYGPKWVRTRTLLDTLNPRWHEQYTWEVFDPCTVITIAVFDNCHLAGNKEDVKDQRIGKVRIRLSTLEADRIYTHYYPLLALQTSGLKKTGELHLAVRFTCTAWVNMVALYGKPLLPKMHYVQPISVIQLDILRHQAMQIVAARLGRAEPPLRREVVEYMLDVDSHMFSLRRSKANFYRITSLLSGIGVIFRWFDGIRNWRNPVTTILVHILFLILICYPELILPTIFLYLFMIGIWNYRFRPRNPPHMDTRLSYAELAHPDELDEEFDTFPTTKPPDIVRMRYDRLRSVAGRVQTVVGDLATQGERAQAILSWRDPRATAIFIMFSLATAVFLYVTPFQVAVVLPGLYLLRHPRFRSKMPSVPYNFYRRLPAKSDMLL